MESIIFYCSIEIPELKCLTDKQLNLNFIREANLIFLLNQNWIAGEFELNGRMKKCTKCSKIFIAFILSIILTYSFPFFLFVRVVIISITKNLSKFEFCKDFIQNIFLFLLFLTESRSIYSWTIFFPNPQNEINVTIKKKSTQFRHPI